MSRKLLHIKHFSGAMLQGAVQVPSSKSQSNRALLINALTHNQCTLHNLSEAHDTILMQALLISKSELIDAEDAGTVMRFLTAYFAIRNVTKTLTGTARMQERPISLLVDALRELGADIDYLIKEGYPPLQINGIDLSWPAQSISIPGHISSQYISALLLIAPLLPLGLTLEITGTISSRPYIDLTLSVMRHFGAVCNWSEQVIIVEPVPYKPAELQIEPDWSSSAYWLSMAALAPEAEIFLPGLSQQTSQADSAAVSIFYSFGVDISFTSEGAFFRKSGRKPATFISLDFISCPDLAPTVIVVAAALGTELQIKGLASLKIKETDRVAALTSELHKIGATLVEETTNSWRLTPGNLPSGAEIEINTYSDHRMAMAFAPLALLFPLSIENAEVVQKSYPGFWQHMNEFGFELKFS